MPAEGVFDPPLSSETRRALGVRVSKQMGSAPCAKAKGVTKIGLCPVRRAVNWAEMGVIREFQWLF